MIRADVVSFLRALVLGTCFILSPSPETSAGVYPYEEKSVDNLLVQYHPRTRALVETAIKLVQEARGSLNTELGFERDLAVRLIIPGSRGEYESYLTGAAAKWSIAFARRPGPETTEKYGTMVIDPAAISPDANPLVATLRHELLHLFLAHLEMDSGRTIPLWFNEGLAQWVARTPVFRDEGDLRLNALKGTLIPLSALTDYFPDRPSRARLAYLESESIVSYLTRHHGPAAPGRIIAGLRQGLDFPEAIFQVSGLTVRDLEARWQKELSATLPNIILSFTHPGTIFVILAVLAVMLFFIWRARQKRRLAQMAEEDRWMESLEDDE